MSFPNFFNPKESEQLFGLREDFDFFKDLFIKKKFPKVILLSGDKGIGKFTLISHLMFFIFDKNNYNFSKNTFDKKNTFFNQFLNDIFSNIIYLDGAKYSHVKIDNIRNLKDMILKSPLNDYQRFIILDHVENFNVNSLNALLKIIEEPSKQNYFILINNKSKILLDTIRSRCLEVRIKITDDNRKKIIFSLINKFKQKLIFDNNISNATPGNFIKFNYIFFQNNLNLNDSYLSNLDKLLFYFKKENDFFYRELVLFYTDYHFKKNMINNSDNNNIIIENRSFVMDKINDFFLYNLNQKTLLSSLKNNFTNE